MQLLQSSAIIVLYDTVLVQTIIKQALASLQAREESACLAPLSSFCDDSTYTYLSFNSCSPQ